MFFIHTLIFLAQVSLDVPSSTYHMFTEVDTNSHRKYFILLTRVFCIKILKCFGLPPVCSQVMY